MQKRHLIKESLERLGVIPPAELVQPGREGLTVTTPEIPPEIIAPLPWTQDNPEILIR